MDASSFCRRSGGWCRLERLLALSSRESWIPFGDLLGVCGFKARVDSTDTAFHQLSQPTVSLCRGKSAHGARLPLHRPLRTDFSAGLLTEGGVGRLCHGLGG